MALNLVTGYKGRDHVTAEQWADFNRGIYGESAILPVGSEMAVTIQTANQITVKDGVAVFDGREVYIGYGESENITIQSGTQGTMRNDIVVVKYTRDEETGVETAAFEVVNGTPVASNPQDPTYQNADIRTGVFISQKPFCRVKINGTAIESIVMLVPVKEFNDVAFSGSYNDLNNKPTSMKANGGNADTVDGKHASDLQNYNNLSNKPTLGNAASKNVANNVTTNVEGSVLDARQGKVLDGKITQLDSKLEIYSEMVGITFTPDGANKEWSWGNYQVPSGYCLLNAILKNSSLLTGNYLGIVTQRYNQPDRVVSFYINWRYSGVWEVLITLAKEKKLS